MYRSYTKIFRIFGAMIIFLQISKNSVLFTNSENKNQHCSSSPFSLTGRPRVSASQRQGAAALPTPTGKTRRRRGSGEGTGTNRITTSRRTYPDPWTSSRHTRDDTTTTMAATAAINAAAHGVSPATTQ